MMHFDVLKLEKITQLRMDDDSMGVFRILSDTLDRHSDVLTGIKAATFETELHRYVYQGVPFTLLFDEQGGETVISVSNKQDYHPIKILLEAL